MRGRAAASRKRQADDEEAGKKKSTTNKKTKKEEATPTKTKKTKAMLHDQPAPPPSSAVAQPPPSLVGPRGWIDRNELIRLLQQALSDDLGLEPVARALAAATGVEREPAAAAGLRDAVSRGDWARVPALFAELGIPRESSVGRAARFVAFREAYLEALRRGDASEAVKVLRREVTPVAPDAATLRALAARLLSAASKKEEEEEEEGTAAAAGSNGAAAATNSNGFGRSSSHGRRSRRHPRGGDDDEEEEAFFDARDASHHHHHHHRPSLPSPLLPPPPASSPASAAFVFSPEAVDCWPGPAAGSRERALEALQSLLLSCSSSSSSASASASASSSSAAVVAGSLLPRHRLLTLLEQALAAQRSAARAHNAPPRPPITLLADYGAAVVAAAGRRWYGNGGGDGLSGAAGAANGNGVGNGGASSSAPSAAALAGASASASPFFSGPLSPAAASALPHVGMDGLPCVTTQVLLDHGDEVWHLAFSPCGTRLATGGADGVAILWHVERDERGRRRVRKGRELRGHAGPVALLAWSPLDAGATLATAGPDGTVRLWDGRSGESVAVLSHHGSLVTAMGWVPVLTNSFAADPPGVSSRMFRRCGRLVTAGHDRCVHLVDAGEAIVAAGSAARARRLRELQRERQRGGGGGGGGRERERERRRRHDLTSPSSSSSSSSSEEEEDAEGEDEEEEEPLPALPPPSTSSRILRTWRGTRVNDLAVTPDGRTLLTVSSDRRVRFWDLSRGAELFRVATAAAGAGRGGRASRLGGGGAATGASDPSSAAQQSQQQPQQPQPPLAVPVVAEAESIISLSLSRDGDALLLNLSNQQLHAWRVPGRHELAPLSVGAGSSSSAEQQQQQRGGGGRGGGSSEDREGGDPPVTITTAAPSSSQAAATGGAAPSSSSQQPAANPAASASAQPPPPPPQPIMTYRGPPARQGRFVVRSCFGGLDDAFALSGAEDCRVYCWDRRSGELLAALDGHSGTVNAVAWNPRDPGMFASASDDKSVHIWGLESDLGDDDEDEEGEEEEGESDDDDDDQGVSL